MTKVTERNGFRAITTLTRLVETDPRIDEVEGCGCDDGRVFIHLAPGFWFGPYEGTHCYTVGSVAELREALAMIEPEPHD